MTALAALLITDVKLNLGDPVIPIDPTAPVAVGSMGDSVFVMGMSPDASHTALLNCMPDYNVCHYTSADFQSTVSHEDFVPFADSIFAQAGVAPTWLDPQALQEAVAIAEEANGNNAITGKELWAALGLARAEGTSDGEPADGEPTEESSATFAYHSFTALFLPSQNIHGQEWFESELNRALLALQLCLEHQACCPERTLHPSLNQILAVGYTENALFMAAWDEEHTTVFVLGYVEEDGTVICGEMSSDLTDEDMIQRFALTCEEVFPLEHADIRPAMDYLASQD